MEKTFPITHAQAPVRTIRLTVIKGPDQGKVVSGSETLSLGTAPGNDLVLTDETVSRHHAEIARKGDRLELVDYDSTNGTSVGSTWITRGYLTPGTVLSVGRSQIRVDDGETAALELFEGHELAGVVGRSAAMRSLMARVQKAAKSDASVLLLGETGTGKEVLARALHRLSPRNDQPFETVDCGSMAPTLIGSELFGHEKGAFTGAHQQHVGAFERAHGGTLFLDEIGELPSALQTALLGALERRSFRRLGGTKPIQVDVRVVCATHRDLRSEVNAGTFRQDLYYRIAVVLLRLIPLRERTEDIAELAEHFMRRAGYSGPVADILPESTLEAMRQHRWPGNVRELRNAVEAALVMGDELDLEPATDGPRPNTESLVDLLDLPYSEAKDILVDRFEGQYVERLLERANGNVTSAARLAGMNRSYLTRVLNRRGLRGRSD